MKRITFELTQEQYDNLPAIVKQYHKTRFFSVGYLLTTNSVKTAKGEKQGYLTGVMYLAPHTICGVNLCPSSTEECRASCLWSSGQLGMPSGRKATIARTVFFNHFPELFFARLQEEIARLDRRARKIGYKLAIRLNGTSDIAFESKKQGRFLQTMMQTFSDVQFYDYTKIIGRCREQYRANNDLGNYHLTFSYSGSNWKACELALKNGVNVAMPFFPEIPQEYNGYEVINGDESDLRFLDYRGVIVGLTYKLPKQLNKKGTLSVFEVPNFVSILN